MPIGSNKTDQVIPNSTHHHGTAIPPQDYSGTGTNTMRAGGNRLTHNHQPEVMGQHPQGGMMNEGGNGAVGTNMAPTTGMGHHAGGMGIPPAPIADTGNQSHGSGHSLAGKVERVAGTLLGSSSLKAKGIQREKEAKAVKVQSSELAEVERLEAEALMRRERAVGHDAHPDNRHLGSSKMPGATQ
ncbi:hypothetical protein C8J56DRAFT_1164152 [Mycena floridula]|nr:hypothetical protein C8J56DRAFT_1164152 [Mycena floridula]